jgi:two-component system alkaline phosphatase synthesis response regulator PhoP
MGTTPRKRILIVEDEIPLARMVTWQLESAGFAVHTETAGKAGLTYALEHHPDLVILDLRLPDINGYEVCRELRKLSMPWTTPILMLTAMDKPIDQLRGYAHGADAYLTKPFEPAELLRTISLLLGQTSLA